MESGVRAIVLLPTYNERDNIEGIVTRLLEENGVGVLVLDDGSPDGTGEVADGLAQKHPGRVEVVHRTGPRGLGRSYIDGMQRAILTGAPFVIQMDADWSHDPVYLPSLIGAAATNDLVIGSRYLHGVSVVNWPLRRILLSVLANRYVRTVTGLAPQDCTAGYRCWRREALARLPLAALASDGYSFQVEMLFEADAAGCSISEVPIIFIERRAGASKVTGTVLLESLIMPWRLWGRRLLRHWRLLPAPSAHGPLAS
jgi:dolichol-phosphate mannosyltransferase